MHAFRTSTRRWRRLVWLTLWTWSFALVSGVVNACVLNLPGRTGEAPAPPAHVEAATHAQLYESLGMHGTDGHEPGAASLHQHGPQQQQGTPAKDTCLKFCDDESSALAKSSSSGVDIGPALVDARVQRYLAVPAAKADSGPLPEQARAQGPPLVIRFLRLTL